MGLKERQANNVMFHFYSSFPVCLLVIRRLRWSAAPCCLFTTARDGPKSGWSILVKRLLSLTEKSWHTGRCGWRATERTVTSLDWIVWWTSFLPWWTVSLEGSEPSAEISLNSFFVFEKEQHYLVRVCGEIYQGHSVCVPPPRPRTLKITVRETRKDTCI